MPGGSHHTVAELFNDVLCFFGNNGTVQKGSMVDIPQLVFYRKLPVSIDHPSVRRTHKFYSGREAIEEGIQIKAHIPKVLVQRNNRFIEAAKNHAPPGLNSWHTFEAQLSLIRFADDFALLWNCHQIPFHRV